MIEACPFCQEPIVIKSISDDLYNFYICHCLKFKWSIEGEHFHLHFGDYYVYYRFWYLEKVKTVFRRKGEGIAIYSLFKSFDSMQELIDFSKIVCYSLAFL